MSKPNKIKDYKSFYHWAKENGMCTVCGKPNDLSISKCNSCNTIHKETYQRHREEYRTRINTNNYNIKRQLFERYGGVCISCGESRLGCLQLDHVNNDGAKHRRELALTSKTRGTRGGVAFYLRMLKLQSIDVDLQILCANCHALKNCKYEAYLTAKT